MELLTKRIETNRRKCHSDMQLTLEDDINVPDVKPDIEQIIKVCGEIRLNTITPEKDRLTVAGVLSFRLLYLCENDIRQIHTMNGQLPFEENINMEGAEPGREATCHYELEDCQCSLINSRKISIRGIVSLHCCQETGASLSVGIGITADSTMQEALDDTFCPEGIEQQFASMAITSCVVSKKDLFRIKEETVLPKGKPNCDSLLYYELSTTGLSTRVVEEGLRITGDLLVFVLYLPEEDERSIEYFETELPFDDTIRCSDVTEDMITDVCITSGKKLVEFRQDEDGENRVLDIEMSLHLDIRFFKEERFDYLKDAYATNCNLKLTKEPSDTRQLRVKNQSSVRIADRIKLVEDHGEIEQICNSTGAIRIDEEQITEDGIEIEGVVDLQLLCLTEDPLRPLIVVEQSIPFQHRIEVRGILETDDYELQTDISSMNAILLDREEIEIKMVLNLCAIVFTENHAEVITSIEESPLDMTEFQNMPGLIGYIVNEGDTLWSIGKQYHTTLDSVRDLNHLESDALHLGDKLLLMKQTEGLL